METLDCLGSVYNAMCFEESTRKTVDFRERKVFREKMRGTSSSGMRDEKKYFVDFSELFL